MLQDILLQYDSNNQYYDIDFDSDGDFLMTEGLETAIFMSLLCEVRADESEVIEPQYRRGDWSNTLNNVEDYEVGSKIWLQEQARADDETLNNGIVYLENSLDWMIDDNIINNRIVEGVIENNAIEYTISITKKNNKIETYNFDGFLATIENN